MAGKSREQVKRERRHWLASLRRKKTIAERYPLGMNRKMPPQSDETRKKRSESLKARGFVPRPYIRDERHRAIMEKIKRERKHHSLDHRDKIAASVKESWKKRKEVKDGDDKRSSDECEKG